MVRPLFIWVWFVDARLYDLRLVFGMVIRENRAGILANPQVDRSFRWGMCWFIFSEIMFFGAFFGGALFFVRVISVPVLSGAGSHFISHVMLWPSFTAGWPAPANPNPSMFVAPKSVMEAFGIPAINTLALLTSGATITPRSLGSLERPSQNHADWTTLNDLTGHELFVSTSS